MTWLAQAEPKVIADWAGAGVAGLVVVALLFGWLWAKPAVDHLLTDLDVSRKELSELNKFVREVVVPALSENNELLERVTDQLTRRRAS